MKKSKYQKYWNYRKTENIIFFENTENTENTENAENTENTENTKNTENTEQKYKSTKVEKLKSWSFEKFLCRNVKCRNEKKSVEM